jgi:hypothetical protein
VVELDRASSLVRSGCHHLNDPRLPPQARFSQALAVIEQLMETNAIRQAESFLAEALDLLVTHRIEGALALTTMLRARALVGRLCSNIETEGLWQQRLEALSRAEAA